MKNIEKLWKLAFNFQKMSKDIFESNKLMDKSFLVEAIDLARTELYQKWSSKEAMDKLAKLSGGKVNKNNYNKIQQGILKIILHVQCEILTDDEFFLKNLPPVEGRFVSQENKIYIRQPTVSYAKEIHSLNDSNFYKLLIEHEITHAINDYLFKMGIYTEALLDRATIPSGKKFSPSDYIYSSDEMVSRMNSVRSGMSIQPHTTGPELASKFFENFKIPYTKEGNLYKITVSGDFAYGAGKDKLPAIKLTLEAIYSHFKPNYGWEVWELIKILIPYVKNIEDAGATLSIWFDLDSLAKSMNQVAIREEKSSSIPV